MSLEPMIDIDYIATIAAVFSLMISFLLYLQQRKYIRNQDKLNKLLIEKEEHLRSTTGKADFRATVRKELDKQVFLVIQNTGKDTALNVTMNPIDLQGWTLHHPPFPVDYWEPNEEKRIRMLGSMQSGPEIKVELFWKDQQGDNNKTLTVQTR